MNLASIQCFVQAFVFQSLAYPFRLAAVQAPFQIVVSIDWLHQFLYLVLQLGAQDLGAYYFPVHTLERVGLSMIVSKSIKSTNWRSKPHYPFWSTNFPD